MLNPIRILAHTLRSREAYEKVLASGTMDGRSPDVESTWKEIVEFYTNDPVCNQTDTDVIFDRLCQKYPRFEDQFKNLRTRIEDQPVSEANFKKDLENELINQACLEVVAAVGSSRTNDQLRTLLDNLNTALEAAEDVEVSTVVHCPSVAEIMEHNRRDALIQIAPDNLNEYLNGGLPKPAHVIIFARPDMGKTSFVINQIKAFCLQDKRVLYYNNEDNQHQFLMRMMATFIGANKKQLEAHADKVPAALEKLKYENLYAVFGETGSFTELERLCKEVEPDIVIVDQLRNFHSRAESRTLEMEALGREMRAFSRRHDVLGISITQAGDSAANKAYLEMSDIDYSKTGLQGTADLIIGIGADEQDIRSGFRSIAFPKNKLSGLRTGPKVQFNQDTGVYF